MFKKKITFSSSHSSAYQSVRETFLSWSELFLPLGLPVTLASVEYPAFLHCSWRCAWLDWVCATGTSQGDAWPAPAFWHINTEWDSVWFMNKWCTSNMWQFWKIWELIQIDKVTFPPLSFNVALLQQLKVFFGPYDCCPPYTVQFILLHFAFFALLVS